ncbi:Gamma-glutamyltranspeptidase [Hyphomicrobiales bacterium]|nr:Gamma-glutamyltranspeptidase [Hyphomicrobiales bacterium]CAH1663070.1 Gamma-glutamyltranspeptidase [Hyphomicrobiales bacterium]
MSQFSPWRQSFFRTCSAALLGISLAVAGASSRLEAQNLAPAPEGATQRTGRVLGEARQFMVAAANPLAAEAGREILRAGGSAVDAAIAVQLVLNLAEPQSSGLGGGAFMLHWDAARRALMALDGRETAPASVTPELFLTAEGKPMPFMEAVVGGRSVGVPGTPRLLEAAHKRWGRLPWARLFEPAIRLADDGFAISPRLNGLLGQEQALRADARARAYFYGEDGNPKAVGALLKSPAMAETLRALARDGMDAFYTGPIAEDIVATVGGHAKNPGGMTLADLKAYAIAERPAICHPYRVYTVCGMGPPSSGGIAIAQMLATLEKQNLARIGQGAEAVHWISEAGRLAYADRAQYLGDPDFLTVPVRGLLDADYLRDRGTLMRPDRSMGRATAGEPPFARRSQLFAPSEGIENGTSHISVVDADGNAVSMTTTIESGFGARIMTASGFLLNNELTDFNFAPSEGGKPVANRVEPGKRPRSSMAPTIVFDAFDRLFVITGSPGGSQIINFVAKTLVAILDWKLDPQVAVDWPNVGSRNGPTELEAGTEAEAWKAPLEALGHQVAVMPMTSGTQAIVLTPAGFLGGADSRREGVAIGD